MTIATDATILASDILAIQSTADSAAALAINSGTISGGALSLIRANGSTIAVTGTVSGGGLTSVGLSLPAMFTVSGSPLTTNGTISATLAPETANTVLAAPNGSAGAPTFRVLALADIPATGASTGYVLTYSGSAVGWSPAAGGGLTSVGLALPAMFTVSGSPLTANGTITATLASETANTFLVAPNGSSGTPTFRTVVYADLPAEVQNSLCQMTLPGTPNPSTKCLIVPIVQNTQVPANFAASSGYAYTNATSNSVYTVAYLRSGSTTTIGTVTFSSGGHTPAFSTQALVNLVAGDVLTITSPSVADLTLADVGLTLVLLKQ